MDDRDIVALFWQRDEKALTETNRKYHAYCFSIARNILYNDQDAEETVNETLLRAWKSIPPHKPAILSTFIGKLTRCAALKTWRDRHAAKRGGGEMPLALDELSECTGGESVDSAMDEKELTELLNAFLKELPAAERDVFLLRYWYLSSIEEIAERFDYTPGKVKTMLWRTRCKLRERLEKEGVII